MLGQLSLDLGLRESCKGEKRRRPKSKIRRIVETPGAGVAVERIPRVPEHSKVLVEDVNKFRDALAHRIPLYIPPYAVEKSKLEEHNRLEQKATAALARGDHVAYDQLGDEQKKLGEFRPWMRHSFYEQSPTIVFHYQLLTDYATIDELALKLLEELEAYSGE